VKRRYDSRSGLTVPHRHGVTNYAHIKSRHSKADCLLFQYRFVAPPLPHKARALRGPVCKSNRPRQRGLGHLAASRRAARRGAYLANRFVCIVCPNGCRLRRQPAKSTKRKRAFKARTCKGLGRAVATAFRGRGGARERADVGITMPTELSGLCDAAGELSPQVTERALAPAGPSSEGALGARSMIYAKTPNQTVGGFIIAVFLYSRFTGRT